MYYWNDGPMVYLWGHPFDLGPAWVSYLVLPRAKPDPRSR